MLLDRIAITAADECGLDKGRLILAGVSGGADSLCLLDVLYRLRYPLVVAHFNHQLRAEAADDARRVAEAAQERGARFVLGTEDVAGYASANNLSLEEAARNLRYHFLFQQARLFSAQAVVVGHTADDQVETVMMHLLRGAGLNGLRGMAFLSHTHGWDADLPLARPLLSTWRAETQSYCTERDLRPVVDITNMDPTYLRNRVRGELIPLMESYNPRVREAIYRIADILAADYQALERVIDKLWDDCISGFGTGYITFDRQDMLAQSPGLQRGIIRRAVEKLRPMMDDFGLDGVERILQFIAHPSRTGKAVLEDGLRLMHEGGEIYLFDRQTNLPSSTWPQISDESSLTIEKPEQRPLANGWYFEVCLLPEAAIDPGPAQNDAAILNNSDPFQAWADAEKVGFPIHIRPRRGGDRWQPLGFENGSQKLADFFINVKCPARARKRWPIVVTGEQILWIPGYRLAHPFRITDSTRRILHFKVWQA